MSDPECEFPAGSRHFPSWVTAGIILILLLLGFSTWLAFRDSRPTWGDETFTLRLATDDWSRFWREILLDVHPPLYFALSKIAAMVPVGSRIAPAGVRVLAYVFHLLLIVFTLGLLNRRIKDPSALFLSGLLLVSSAHLALFGPMMRYYALSGIGAVSATLLLIPEIDNGADSGKMGIGRTLLYGIALIVAFASSYITLVVLPAHVIYILRKPKGKPPLSAAFGASLLLSIPLFFLLSRQLSSQPLSSQLGNPIDFLAGAIARLAFTVYSFSFGEFIRPWTPLALPAILSLAWFVGLSWKLRKTELGGLLWLTVGTALPLGAIALTRTGIGVEFSASRVLFIAPLFLLLLGMAPSAYPCGSLARKSGIVAIGIFVIINIVSTWNFHSGTNFIQSTYVIPWEKIGIDAGHEIKSDSFLCYDDDTLVYWLIPETLPMSDINLNNLPPEINDPSQLSKPFPLMPVPVSFVVVFSPGDRGPAAYVQQMFGDSSAYSLQSETRYLTEDETSVRWKQMLLGRTVEPVKKVLRVYVRR